MSLDDDFFLCWFVVKEKNLFLLDFGSQSFLFYLKKSKISSLYLKKKTQAHQTLRFFSILNTSRQ